jgi:DNA/RNA endonuclease YhcR with UshA esterase domain
MRFSSTALALALLLAPIGGSLRAAAVDPGTVTEAAIGQTLMIEGKVKEFTPSTATRTPFRVVVEGPTGELLLVFWPDMKNDVMGTAETIPVGTVVKAKGTIGTHRDRLQLQVKEARMVNFVGITPTEAPAATPETPIEFAMPGADGYFTPDDAERMKSRLGKDVAVRGTIASFKPSWSERAPHTITLSGATGTVDIVYWKTGEDTPTFDQTGKELFVLGEYQQYRDRLQVKVESVSTISYEPLEPALVAKSNVAPTPRASQPPASAGWPGAQPPKDPAAATPAVPAEPVAAGTVVPIGRVTPELEGQTITVEANAAIVSPRFGRTLVMLRDGGAQLVAVLPTSMKAPEVGQTVKLTGKIVMNTVRVQPELHVE